MSKYTGEELKEMALTWVNAQNMGTIEALHVVITISVLTELDPQVVVEHIKELARYEA